MEVDQRLTGPVHDLDPAIRCLGGGNPRFTAVAALDTAIDDLAEIADPGARAEATEAAIRSAVPSRLVLQPFSLKAS